MDAAGRTIYPCEQEIASLTSSPPQQRGRFEVRSVDKDGSSVLSSVASSQDLSSQFDKPAVASGDEQRGRFGIRNVDGKPEGAQSVTPSASSHDLAQLGQAQPAATSDETQERPRRGSQKLTCTQLTRLVTA